MKAKRGEADVRLVGDMQGYLTHAGEVPVPLIKAIKGPGRPGKGADDLKTLIYRPLLLCFLRREANEILSIQTREEREL